MTLTVFRKDIMSDGSQNIKFHVIPSKAQTYTFTLSALQSGLFLQKPGTNGEPVSVMKVVFMVFWTLGSLASKE